MMIPEAILVAGITAAATIICQVLISCRTTSLMAYRIDQLEDKVGKHNQLVERMYAVEARAKSNTHRLDDLEQCK